MTPLQFTAACSLIVGTERGHQAHRSLDLLTNRVLRELGYGTGVDIFEGAVAKWHSQDDPYPYSGPCPDCRG